MISDELLALVNSGKQVLVKFTDNQEQFECQWDEGSIARITRGFEDGFGCIGFVVDESEFKEYNKRIEKSEWLDDSGNPTLKYSEIHDRLDMDTIFEDVGEELYNFVIIEELPKQELFNEFKLTNQTSYVEWLEVELLKLRNSK